VVRPQDDATVLDFADRCVSSCDFPAHAAYSPTVILLQVLEKPIVVAEKSQEQSRSLQDRAKPFLCRKQTPGVLLELQREVAKQQIHESHEAL